MVTVASRLPFAVRHLLGTHLHRMSYCTFPEKNSQTVQQLLSYFIWKKRERKIHTTCEFMCMVCLHHEDVFERFPINFKQTVIKISCRYGVRNWRVFAHRAVRIVISLFGLAGSKNRVGSFRNRVGSHFWIKRRWTLWRRGNGECGNCGAADDLVGMAPAADSPSAGPPSLQLLYLRLEEYCTPNSSYRCEPEASTNGVVGRPIPPTFSKLGGGD